MTPEQNPHEHCSTQCEKEVFRPTSDLSQPSLLRNVPMTTSDRSSAPARSDIAEAIEHFQKQFDEYCIDSTPFDNEKVYWNRIKTIITAASESNNWRETSVIATRELAALSVEAERLRDDLKDAREVLAAMDVQTDTIRAKLTALEAGQAEVTENDLIILFERNLSTGSYNGAQDAIAAIASKYPNGIRIVKGE